MIIGCREGGENVACIIAVSGEAVAPLLMYACRRNFVDVVLASALMDMPLCPGCSLDLKDPISLLRAWCVRLRASQSQRRRILALLDLQYMLSLPLPPKTMRRDGVDDWR
jgi:hypothetical protein